ncbi:hypothetical protein B0T16DRAFT_388831 [Cercophora newfieldiana]|uniref:Uncharacterized protein n=1 Tax=Cercophora newfieldiana TaxID=92897 RepID=A0AA39YBR4_9PEZI|nr:hypothetical protein B0T16DRAFT_388831 [Cercophora newfieldiana]
MASHFQLHAETSQIVPCPPGTLRRFHEVVTFLESLKDLFYQESATRCVAEPEGSAVERDPKQLYTCFVNKLSQICDTTRGDNGATITAFAVRQSGTVEYLFASNRRSASELAAVQTFIVDILEMLGMASDDVIERADYRSDIFRNLLEKILLFNRPRVAYYIKQLSDNLEFCLDKARDEETDEAKEALKCFEALGLKVGLAAQNREAESEKFFTHSRELLFATKALYHGPLEDFLRAKSSEDRQGPAATPWSEAHHALGRLVSYFIAVKVLISTRKRWLELFVDFDVVALPSSEPGDTPSVRRTAKGMVERMNRDRVITQLYQRLAPQLQEMGLDEIIKKKTHPRKFAPIVHAEILVDDYIRRQDRTMPPDEDQVRYFKESSFGRYIGSSKPTCRLCWLYFEQHPDEVRVRPSHHNLYYLWRAPDVFVEDGPEAAAAMKDVLESMIRAIRAETSRALRDRSAIRNFFDSNNTPSNPLRTTDRATGGSNPSDLVSQMSDLSVSTVRHSPDLSRDTTPETEPGTPPHDYLAAQIGQ